MSKNFKKRLLHYALMVNIIWLTGCNATVVDSRLYEVTSLPDYLYLENGQSFTNKTGRSITLASERVIQEKDAIISDLRLTLNEIILKGNLK